MDFIKGIACVFVVFMHVEFPGHFGIAVQAISRFCVPFFFMVSGYFCFKPNANKEDTGKSIRKKLSHVGRITFFACVFYIAFVLVQQILLHNQNFTLSLLDLVKWAVFNDPEIVAGQYWFLFALLYAYAIYGILELLNLRRLEYPLAIVMFFIYVILAQGMHLAGVYVPNFVYRNWLVEAFPFFMLGHWIRENQDRITFSNNTLLLIGGVFTLLCLAERLFLGRDFGVNICTIPQVFALFVYGVKNPASHKGVIQRLGRDCSMLVYIYCIP